MGMTDEEYISTYKILSLEYAKDIEKLVKNPPVDKVITKSFRDLTDTYHNSIEEHTYKYAKSYVNYSIDELCTIKSLETSKNYSFIITEMSVKISPEGFPLMLIVGSKVRRDLKPSKVDRKILLTNYKGIYTFNNPFL